MYKYAYLFCFLFLAFPQCSPPKGGDQVVEKLKVMSFNVLYSTSVASTIKAIEQSGADIIGLQEASDERIEECAKALGFYQVAFAKTASNGSDSDTGILSRYTITETFRDGVMVRLPSGQQLAVFSVHLSPYPYEPYDFRDGKIEESAQAEKQAGDTRIPEIRGTYQHIEELLEQGMPVFLTGDFNEPSHLDWTTRAAKADMHFQKVVSWPCSMAATEIGLTDSFREFAENEIKQPGITWTTRESDNEVYDRIDFVYHHLQDQFSLESSALIGGKGNKWYSR